MNKLTTLKNSKLFNLLISWISIAGFIAMQFPLSNAYIIGSIKSYIPLAIFSIILVIAFAFWFSLTVFNDIKISKIVIFTAIYSIIVCCVYLLSPAIMNIYNNNSKACFMFGSFTADAILIVSFIFGWMISYNQNKKISIAAVAVVLIGIITMISLHTSTLMNVSTKNAIKKFDITDTLPDGKGTKVHVILLNGQSNASGVARNEYLTDDQMKVYEKGFDNVYINFFTENGNNSSKGSFVRTGLNQGYDIGFFGPEIGIAETLSSACSNELFVIIKYAWGGSILDGQWLKNGKEGDLYDAFISFTVSCMEYLRSRNYDAKIDAMCWMQGESDAANKKICNKYFDNTKALVNYMRRDLSEYSSDKGIAFIDAGISNSKHWKYYSVINQSKKDFAEDAANNAFFIDTIAANLDYSKEPYNSPDLAHFDASSEIKLGNLFAQTILSVISD